VLKKEPAGSFFDTRNLFAKLFDFVQSFSARPTLYQNAKIRKQMGSSICSYLFDILEFDGITTALSHWQS
jgi:hypothetical protein